MSVQVLGADKGPCPLCLKDKEKKLFAVSAPGYPPKVCADHLYVIAEQLPKGKKPEDPTLPFEQRA
jgi:hypothetical protein